MQIDQTEVARTRMLVASANRHYQNHGGEFENCSRMECVHARASTDPVEQAVTVVSAEYGEVEAALAQDHLVRQMAAELKQQWNDPAQRASMVDSSGSPRHDFMLAALRTYHGRGGTIGCHIGAVANAITDILGG